MAAIAPEYVAARRVLLDARDALAPQRQAVIVVGAQAIYLRTGEGEVGIAPYTTDADLALDPRALQAQPPLEAAMRAAEFTLRLHSPGAWVAIATIDGTEAEISVDLMVPSGFAPAAVAVPVSVRTESTPLGWRLVWRPRLSITRR